MSILVVGSVALDSVKTPSGKREGVLGGSAVYFSLAASHLAPVSLVAVVGEDFPAAHRDLLKNKKIDLTGLETAPGQTFRWSGVYGNNLNERTTIFTHLNVFADFKPKIPNMYCDKKFLFLANIDPVLQIDVLMQVKKPQLVACDTMNLWIANKRKDLLRLLRSVDIFFINETEAQELSGKINLAACAKAIRKMGPQIVVIKRGEYGAVVFYKQTVFCLPAFVLENVVDPTGAGDTFAGGFIGYLARAGKVSDQNLRRAAVYGTVMASFAVEAFSVEKLSRLTQRDLAGRLAAFKKITAY